MINIITTGQNELSWVRFVNAIIICYLPILLPCVTGCDGGSDLEGEVHFWAGGAASGVQVQASTSTKIKEEQSKAVKTVTTNAQGIFRFRGLLPQKDYEVTVVDTQFKSTSQFATTSLEGTTILDNTIWIVHIPEKAGVWHYPSGLEEPNNVLEMPSASPVQIQEHLILEDKLKKRDWRIAYALGVDVSPLRIRGTGVLVFQDSPIQEIIPMMGFEGKLEFPGNETITIPEGYYYNIRSFTLTKAAGSRLLRPEWFGSWWSDLLDSDQIETPFQYDFSDTKHNYSRLSRGVMRIDDNVWVIKLKPGLYFFTTSLREERSPRYGRAPQAGYFVKVSLN